MDINKKLEAILENVQALGYWTLPIPSKVDNEIMECIHFYNSSAPKEQLRTKQSITTAVARLLLYFSERMATLSLKTKSQTTFDGGLVSLSLVVGKVDIREITILFSLYFDVSRKNGISFDGVLKQPGEFTENLISFLGRSDKDKQIESMGYTIEVNSMKEPAYRRAW